MKVDGISPVSAQEFQGVVRQPETTPQKKAANTGEIAKGAGTTEQVIQQGRQDPVELEIGSKVHVAGLSGIAETYARIRFDEQSRTVLIQIVNAANDEVIREIPPGAWEKLRGVRPPPKSTVVDKGK